MSELKTAEELVAQLRLRPLLGSSDLDNITEGFRACQRNALEAAAKAVCPQCETNVLRDYVPHVGVVHVAPAGQRMECKAKVIWVLLAMNPAPAGTVAKEANNR